MFEDHTESIIQELEVKLKDFQETFFNLVIFKKQCITVFALSTYYKLGSKKGREISNLVNSLCETVRSIR